MNSTIISAHVPLNRDHGGLFPEAYWSAETLGHEQ